MATQVIGMMEGAFFVPKGEILNWINTTLNLSLTKIEQLGTGAAYCQIIDLMYPSKIKLKSINWKARNEWEFIVNFQILQQYFLKSNIQKHIDIEKLSKAKYQDNLQFAQWLQRYYDLSGTTVPKDYDAVAKRGTTDIDFTFVEMRENPRIAQIQQQRERISQCSADARFNSFATRIQDSSRSQSPLFKVESKIGQNKSQELKIRISKFSLQQRDFLMKKFKEIEEITNIQELQSDQKIYAIQGVISSIYAVYLSNNNLYQHCTTSICNDNPILSESLKPKLFQRNRNSSMERRVFQDEKIIMQEKEIEELISPSRSENHTSGQQQIDLQGKEEIIESGLIKNASFQQHDLGQDKEVLSPKNEENTGYKSKTDAIIEQKNSNHGNQPTINLGKKDEHHVIRQGNNSFGPGKKDTKK